MGSGNIKRNYFTQWEISIASYVEGSKDANQTPAQLQSPASPINHSLPAKATPTSPSHETDTASAVMIDGQPLNCHWTDDEAEKSSLDVVTV